MTPASHYQPGRRIVALLLVLVLAIAALVFQLLRLQVLDNDRYLAWGEDQRMRTESLLGKRGDIVDRNGEELAISLQAPVIVADPLLVTDAAAQAEALAPVLGAEVAEVQAALSSPGRFVYLARPTTEAVADEVRKLGLDGVFIREEPERFHPNDESLARGVLGQVGVDNTGLSGLEAQYEDVLAGTAGERITERGINGKSIPEGVREMLPAVDGADIELTIDRALQFEVERALRASVEANGAKGGTVILSDPSTGEVLAMASVATTDSGRVATTSDNRAITWTYEPASVMKAITFSAVLNEGEATPTSKRVIPSKIDLWEETFRDETDYGTEWMSVTDILVRSSNTGTITWAGELEEATFYKYLQGFGFGSRTGLGFPGESPGLLDDVATWPGTHYATIALGQSIGVTPMQMLAAYNVIANDGVYLSPRLVKSVGGQNTQPLQERRVIESETAAEVAEMLSRVVAGGTAVRAQVPGYNIAAKTGTARKIQESGGYVDSAGYFHYIATVTGFFPAEDPKLSMIVVIDEPATDIFASKVAAPLFGELAAWSLRHYRISPAGDVVFAGDDDIAAIGTDESLPSDLGGN